MAGANMHILYELAGAYEFLSALDDEHKFTAFVEHNRDGLQFYRDIVGRKLIEHLGSLEKEYGRGFRFRAFNRHMDLSWRGDHGVVVEGDIDESKLKDFYFETDTGRHPGMLAPAEALGDLHQCRVRGLLLDDGCYLRLVEITPGGDR